MLFNPTQTADDTARAEGKTFVRREFMLPPVNIPESAVNPPRTIRGEHYIDELDGQQAVDSTGLPDGAAGDVLYHDGTDWVVLNKPSAGGNNAVLRHNGTAPYWEKPVDCS